MILKTNTFSDHKIWTNPISWSKTYSISVTHTHGIFYSRCWNFFKIRSSYWEVHFHPPWIFSNIGQTFLKWSKIF